MVQVLLFFLATPGCRTDTGTIPVSCRCSQAPVFSLAAAYDTEMAKQIARTKIDVSEQEVLLKDVYNILTPLPRQKRDYPALLFAFDLHRVLKSGCLNASDGRKLWLGNVRNIRQAMVVLDAQGQAQRFGVNYAAHNLHPKLEAVLKNYLYGSGDAYNQHILASDMAGDFIPYAQLKSIHRLNFGKPLALTPFKVKENTFDYFRFLSRLIRAAGYAGWVILLDEFEQLMYLGIMARSNAYLNAARFMSPSFGLTGTYSVFSASSNLWPELIWKQKNSDYDIVPQKLVAKGRQYDIPTVREVFSSLLKETLFLDTISTFDIRRMLQAVREQHALAYDWQAPEDISQAFIMCGTCSSCGLSVSSMDINVIKGKQANESGFAQGVL